MEVRVLKSFMFGGKPAPVDSVVDMPVADAAYVVGLRRAEYIAAAPAVAAIAAEAKPARARKARES